MLRRSTFGIVFAVCAASAAAEPLQWKFKQGDVFYMEEVMQQNQVIEVAGQTQRKNTTQTTVTRFTIGRVPDDGSVEIQMEIVEIREAGDQQDAAAKALLKKMQGAAFQITLDAERQITRFEGYDAFVKRIAGDNKQLAMVFRSILSEESFRKMVRQTFTIAPNRQVQEGDSWTQDLTMSLGPFGNVNLTRRLTHNGTEIPEGHNQEYVKLDLTGTAKYQVPKGNFPGLPFKITGGNLEFNGIRGGGHFDAARGRLVELAVHLNLTGNLAISVANQQADVTLDQQQTGTIRILDENPLKETTEEKPPEE